MTQSSTGRPRPPYSSGTAMPSTPISARSLMFSNGKVPSCHFFTRGLNFSCTSERTEPTMARCSGVNSKFIRHSLFLLSVLFSENRRAPFRERAQTFGVVRRREDIRQGGAFGQQAFGEALLHAGADHALQGPHAARRARGDEARVTKNARVQLLIRRHVLHQAPGRGGFGVDRL